MLSRRSFVTSSLSSLALLSPLMAKASHPYPASKQDQMIALIRDDKAPRQVWLKRGKDQAIITYGESGKLILPEYHKACYLLRDTRQNITVAMDIQVLDVLTMVQRFLLLHNVRVPLNIHSGYRSEATNSSIEGAAKNSLHKLGKAVDLHIEGIPSETLARLGLFLGKGGVGFYPKSGFVHLDTGVRRFWQK